MQFLEGRPMPNAKLRLLIYEMQDCRYLSDKLALLRRDVHNIQDLVEVLNNCFWADECQALYGRMQDLELALLLRHSRARERDEFSLWDEGSEWEKQLEQYVAALDETRRERINTITKDLSL